MVTAQAANHALGWGNDSIIPPDKPKPTKSVSTARKTTAYEEDRM